MEARPVRTCDLLRVKPALVAADLTRRGEDVAVCTRLKPRLTSVRACPRDRVDGKRQRAA